MTNIAIPLQEGAMLPPSYESAIISSPVREGATRPPRAAVDLTEVERETIDELANLASIFRATDSLEKFFTRNKITADDYTRECSLLITQFKALEKTLVSTKIIPNVDAFVRQYLTENGVKARWVERAYNRLVVVGQPETVINAILSSHKIKPSDISDITKSLITAEDAVAMDIRNMDQLLPLLAEVRSNLSRVAALPADFVAKTKVLAWVERLQALRADAEISEEDKKTLGLDLELSKQAWFAFLQDM